MHVEVQRAEAFSICQVLPLSHQCMFKAGAFPVCQGKVEIHQLYHHLRDIDACSRLGG